MQDWLWMTAADLGRGIAAGQIDPIDLTETYLAAIDAHPLTPRIYARVTHDRARAEARAASARAKAKARLSALDGVPISWKDLFDTAGIGTEAGTRLMEGRVPDRDAKVLQNATAAGLICLGKTHMSEIAFSILGYNPVMGTPPHRSDPDVVPGGSSSGAAASVAHGLAAAGIGSDTGGSVRVPAAWNDLVGLKTTHGRLSLEGVVPLCETLDTVGPLCRSVEDAGLLLAALEGRKPADLAATSLKDRRLGIMRNFTMDALGPEPAKGFANAVAAFEAAGAIIEDFTMPRITRPFEFAGLLYVADAWAFWGDRIAAAPEKMFFQIYDRIRPGADVKAADFLRAWRELHEIRAEYAELTAGFDAVIMPTSAVLPPNTERLGSDRDYYLTENLRASRNTRLGNLMGLSALSLPTGLASTGVMLCAGPGREEALLRLGTAAEAALS